MPPHPGPLHEPCAPKAPNSKRQAPEKHQTPSDKRPAPCVSGRAKSVAADCQSAIQQTKLSALQLHGCKGSRVQCAKFSFGKISPPRGRGGAELGCQNSIPVKRWFLH